MENYSTGINGGLDTLTLKAASLIAEHGSASSSLLQRKLKLGYNRAYRILFSLEQLGILGKDNGIRPRDILVTDKEEISSIINSAKR